MAFNLKLSRVPGDMLSDKEIAATKRVAQMFSQRDISFRKHKIPSARLLHQEQIRVWSFICDQCKKHVAGSPQTRQQLSSALTSIPQRIQASFHDIYGIEERENDIHVFGKLPVVQLDDAEYVFENDGALAMLAAIGLEVAPFLDRHADTFGQPGLTTIFETPFMAALFGKYSAIGTIEYMRRDAVEAAHAETEARSASTRSAEEALNKIRQRAETSIEDFQRTLSADIVTYSDSLDEIKEKANISRATIEEDWQNAKGVQKAAFDLWFEEEQRKTTAARAEMVERSSLQSAQSVWRKKGTRHRIGFWVGLAVLTVCVSASLYMVFSNWIVIKSELLTLRKQDGDLPYSLIALSLVPVVAVGWLLRFAGRAVISAQTLAEDAEHRRAMIETYFRLVGDPSAGMETTDRLLILAAIFRPTAGSQGDDLSPPTVLDMAKAAVERK